MEGLGTCYPDLSWGAVACREEGEYRSETESKDESSYMFIYVWISLSVFV